MAFPTKKESTPETTKSTTEEVVAQPEDSKEIKARYTDPNYGSVRKMGRNVSRSEDDAINFYSIAKNTVLYANQETFIEFKNYEYKTDNEFDIDFIRKSPLFGREIFEGKFPKHVLEMFAQRRKDLHDFPEEKATVLRG